MGYIGNGNTYNWKKPALTRVHKPTPAVFLCLVTFIFDLLNPK